MGLAVVRGMIVLSLLAYRFIFNICLVKERTLINTRAFHMRILVGIFVNVARGWDGGIRVRNAFPIRMGSARLNSAVISLAMSGRNSEIARVKVCPFLQVISYRALYETVFCVP